MGLPAHYDEVPGPVPKQDAALDLSALRSPSDTKTHVPVSRSAKLAPGRVNVRLPRACALMSLGLQRALWGVWSSILLWGQSRTSWWWTGSPIPTRMSYHTRSWIALAAPLRYSPLGTLVAPV